MAGVVVGSVKDKFLNSGRLRLLEMSVILIRFQWSSVEPGWTLGMSN